MIDNLNVQLTNKGCDFFATLIHFTLFINYSLYTVHGKSISSDANCR